jgi:hypothetical protein
MGGLRPWTANSESHTSADTNANANTDADADTNANTDLVG